MELNRTTNGSGNSNELPTEVPEPDQIASGMAGTGQENEKKDIASKKPIIAGSARKVTRKTELQFAAASFMDSSEIRKRKERDLKFPDADIPYYKAEAALRDLVCSILERDDRMNEDMFLRWNGLKHRIEDLEDEIQALKIRETGTDWEVPE